MPGTEHSPSIIAHEPYRVESKEHTRPLIATVSYVTDMEGDSLVRIFDNHIALRDEPFCVGREALQGRTAEQSRDYFGLRFVPKFICDVRIPPGNTIVLCKLVNSAGQTVNIYYPRDYLELGNERLFV